MLSFNRPILILNPAAGRRPRRLLTHQAFKALEDWLPELKIFTPSGPEQTVQAARDAVRGGHDFVIGAGGDGTINALMNGIIGSEAVLGILPVGTGNSIARELGLPNHPVAAVNALREGTIMEVSLGSTDHRCFGLMIGIGFDGYAVRQVPDWLKRTTGRISYVWAGLVSLLRYRYPTIKIAVDGKPLTATTVIIAKSKYYSSSFRIAPKAFLKDPVFQVCAFTGRGPWRYIWYALAVILDRHTQLNDVRMIMAKEVRVEASTDLAAHMDGEPLPALPSSIQITSQRLRVLFPKRPSG